MARSRRSRRTRRGGACDVYTKEKGCVSNDAFVRANGAWHDIPKPKSYLERAGNYLERAGNYFNKLTATTYGKKAWGGRRSRRSRR